MSAVLIWTILPPAFFWDSPPWYYILFNQWRAVMLSELEGGRGQYQEQPWSVWKKENIMCRASLNIFSCLIFVSGQISHNEWKINFLKVQLLPTCKQNVPGGQEGSHTQPDRAQRCPPQSYACKQMIPTGHHDGGSSHTSSVKPAWGGAAPQCTYTYACWTGSKQEGIEGCVQSYWR